jgi:hypothetical protein
MLRKFSTCLLLAGALSCTHAAALAQPSKHALNPGNMKELHRLIGLQEGEFIWDQAPWYTSIWHARKAAAAQDKPILVFGTGGAGFNDPLGNC